MIASHFHALIRTHHITSRKKVSTLKSAARKFDCYALLKSGGVPGIMFVEGRDATDVQRWVDLVRGLRYKDYQLVSAVAEAPSKSIATFSGTGFLEEVSTVKKMAILMEKKHLLDWWRSSMHFSQG